MKERLPEIKDEDIPDSPEMKEPLVAKHTRPSWDEYFMDVANSISKRATCDRGRSGCVIAKDKEILVTGYVGSPRGFPHCDEEGHIFEDRWLTENQKDPNNKEELWTTHCIRTIHAEQNAIYQAARKGISIIGSTMYCRMTPCRVCAMAIVQCGIKRVVCERKYQKAEESETMFEQAKIRIEYVHDEVQEYPGE